MGKIVISENISLDGVVEDPTGEDGFSRGNWFAEFGGKDFPEWAKVEQAEALAADALLLGRRTDDWFARTWASRTGDWADRLNSMPKYVVSMTLDHPRWSNATLLKGDVASEVSALKQQIGGEIVVYASIQLAHTLIAADLADELRLTVYPVALGTGKRLFPETTGKKPLRLTGSRTIGAGLAFLTYDFVRDA
jgi:dihydrofolate reductase